LLLQGIVGANVKLNDDSVLPNMLPTTWIDLEHHTIKQTPPFHEYNLLRKHFSDFDLGQFIGVPDMAATQSLRDLLKYFSPSHSFLSCLLLVLRSYVTFVEMAYSKHQSKTFLIHLLYKESFTTSTGFALLPYVRLVFLRVSAHFFARLQ
jgi:hypothetical protein